MKKYLFVLCIAMSVSSSALAENQSYSIVGAFNYNFDSATASVGPVTATVKGGLGYGGGLLVGTEILEGGFIYLNRGYTTSVTGRSDTHSSFSYVELPATFRLGKGASNFGVGAFYDIGISSGLASQYGVTAGPRLSLGKLFLDFRFNYGFQSGGSKDALALIGYPLSGK